jgi:hypothetical protein
MSFKSNRVTSSHKLPTVLAIGFSGHRKLVDEDKCRENIRRVLGDWKAKALGRVYGVSSVAAGGDLLFAESCIELDLPIRILLPSPAEKFREDFDEETWKRAERVMASALSVEVKSFSQEPTERYYECGIETVDQSQLLVALWDGQDSRGMGGTSDMVHFAKCLSRPIIWIHSVTGAVQFLNENPDLTSDAELEFLNQLPDASMHFEVSTPRGLADAWFAKVDQNASRAAPQFRRLAAIPIFCTAVAALLIGRVASGGQNVIWLWAGTAFGAMAAVLPTVMRLTHRQVTWTRMRAAAEVCRSCIALWQTPTLYDAVGPEVVPELAGMLTSLNFLKMSGRSAQPATLDQFKRLYRESRVQHQITYFSNHASRAAAAMRRYQIVVWASIFFAGSFNVWMLLSEHGLTGWSLGRWKPVLALAATTGFQIATVAGALLVVNDCERRRDRYRELHRMLTQWDLQLELSQTWWTALRITSLIEKALLAELIEWRSHIRNRKIPQK